LREGWQRDRRGQQGNEKMPLHSHACLPTDSLGLSRPATWRLLSQSDNIAAPPRIAAGSCRGKNAVAATLVIALRPTDHDEPHEVT
jgi:hypothetical protein